MDAVDIMRRVMDIAEYYAYPLVIFVIPGLFLTEVALHYGWAAHRARVSGASDGHAAEMAICSAVGVVACVAGALLFVVNS